MYLLQCRETLSAFIQIVEDNFSSIVFFPPSQIAYIFKWQYNTNYTCIIVTSVKIVHIYQRVLIYPQRKTITEKYKGRFENCHSKPHITLFSNMPSPLLFLMVLSCFYQKENSLLNLIEFRAFWKFCKKVTPPQILFEVLRYFGETSPAIKWTPQFLFLRHGFHKNFIIFKFHVCIYKCVYICIYAYIHILYTYFDIYWCAKVFQFKI